MNCMKYLIMRCYETYDVDYCEPVTMVDDWKQWYENTQPDYLTEVYSYDGEQFIQVKSHYQSYKNGMAFYYWDIGEDPAIDKPHVIKKWPDRSSDEEVPEEIKNWAEQKRYDCMGDHFDLELALHDFPRDDNISWFTGTFVDGKFKPNRYYVYGEYEDFHYSVGY